MVVVGWPAGERNRMTGMGPHIPELIMEPIPPKTVRLRWERREFPKKCVVGIKERQKCLTQSEQISMTNLHREIGSYFF